MRALCVHRVFVFIHLGVHQNCYICFLMLAFLNGHPWLYIYNIYIYIYLSIYAYTYIYTYIYVYICIHIYVCRYTYITRSKYIRTYIYIHVNTYSPSYGQELQFWCRDFYWKPCSQAHSRELSLSGSVSVSHRFFLLVVVSLGCWYVP